jgi:hypothetical protein
MDKKNKGLADNQEGEFILNESGTSVTVDPNYSDEKDAPETAGKSITRDDEDRTSGKE